MSTDIRLETTTQKRLLDLARQLEVINRVLSPERCKAVGIKRLTTNR